MVPWIATSYPVPGVAKQDQNITLPPSCLTVSKMFIFWNVSCNKKYLPSSTSVLSQHRQFVGVCLGTQPWMWFLSSIFNIVESLTLIVAKEANSSLVVVLGSIVSSKMSRLCALRANSMNLPLLVKFTHGPCVLNLWIMALTVTCWKCKAFGIT